MLAASQGHAEALAVLLEAGARALGRDATGRTALHWAAVNAHADAVGVLLDAGADPRVVDRDGYAPLHLAVTADADPLRVVRTLLRASADPNQLAHGLLPLTLAERRGHTAAADALRDVTR
jgi:ankyrin repeat protein